MDEKYRHYDHDGKIIESIFWTKINEMDQSVSMDHAKIKLSIKSLEIVSPRKLTQTFCKTKEDFIRAGNLNTIEIIVFQGCNAKKAHEISEENINVDNSGIYLTTHPGLALNDGLTVVAFKSIPEVLTNAKDYLFFKSNQQLLPYGIIHLNFQIAPGEDFIPFPKAQ